MNPEAREDLERLIAQLLIERWQAKQTPAPAVNVVKPKEQAQNPPA